MTLQIRPFADEDLETEIRQRDQREPVNADADPVKNRALRCPMTSPPFEFHPLTEARLPMLCQWLNRPHLQQWWREGIISLEAVRQHYLPRIVDPDTAHPYLALINDQPVGYIQYYRAAEGKVPWWPDQPGPGVLGINQFLADEDRLGQGLGTAMVSQFVARLMQDPGVTEIRVDPRPDNRRAIRCYEKVGFRAVGPITTPDGPALMMVLAR